MSETSLEDLIRMQQQAGASGQANAPQTPPSSGDPLRIEITQDASDLEQQRQAEGERQAEILATIDRLEAVPPSEATSPSNIGVSGAFFSGISQGLANKPSVELGIISPGFDYEDMNKGEGIFFQIGKSISDNVPFLLMPQALISRFASGGTQLAGAASTRFERMVSPLTEGFRSSPRTFGAVELGSVAGAAQGRGIAETVAPGDTAIGMGAEMLGSVVNPAGTLARGAKAGGGGIYRMASRWTKPGRQRDAAELIQGVARGFGEDPQVLSAYIQKYQDLPGLPGQKIDSKTFTAMHRNMVERNPEFRNTSLDALQEMDNYIQDNIARLYSSGDPDAVQMALRMRKQYFEDTLKQARETAEYQAEVAASNMTRGLSGKDAQEAQAAASKSVVDEINRAMRNANSIQDDLYEKGLNSLRVNLGDMDVDEAFPSTMRMLQNVGDRSLPGEDYMETLRAVYGSRIGNSLDRLMSTETPTPKEVYEMARVAGSRAANLRASGNYAEAQPLEELRRAIINDIDGFRSPELRLASDYTAAYHRVFDDTYVAKATPSSPQAAITSPPEGMLNRAIAPGGVTARDRLRQLEDASAFAATRENPLEGMNASSANVKGAVEEFLFANANQFIRDGEINPRTLRTFVDRNAALLDEFPAVRDALIDAETAQKVLSDLVAEQNVFNKQVVNRRIFERILRAGTPDSATSLEVELGRVLTGNPRVAIKEIAESVNDPKFIQNSDELTAARQGMAYSIYEAAARRATVDGKINWKTLTDTLLGPTGRDGPSILKLLNENKILNDVEYKAAVDIFSQAQQRAAASTSQYRISDLASETDMMSQLIMRSSGSMIATRMLRMFNQSGEAGPSLIAAHAGSQAAQRIMGLDPQGKVMQIIIEAQSNPALMRELLDRNVGTSVARHNRHLRNFHSALYGAGVTGVSDLTEEDLEFYNVPNFEKMRREAELESSQ